ncbi:hypothetical protein AS890_06975 [Rhizobium anhuiense bv. trifolii]|nr:hypothetical protein [Rhizobium anhuiense]KZS56954.1 hypothetical protein AS890_06975 [Rhizobium anhuiense bv. trifolii]
MLENPSYDLGLFSVDFPFARDAIAFGIIDQLRAIPVGDSAGSPTFRDRGLHALACPEAGLLDHLVADHGAEAEFHVADRATFIHCPKFNAVVAQLLQDAGTVLHVARNAVNRHAEENVDTAALDPAQHGLNAGSRLQLCSGDRPILENFNNVPTAYTRKFPAERHLCLDGLFILAIGRESGIEEYGLGHDGSSRNQGR